AASNSTLLGRATNRRAVIVIDDRNGLVTTEIERMLTTTGYTGKTIDVEEAQTGQQKKEQPVYYALAPQGTVSSCMTSSKSSWGLILCAKVPGVEFTDGAIRGVTRDGKEFRTNLYVYNDTDKGKFVVARTISSGGNGFQSPEVMTGLTRAEI